MLNIKKFNPMFTGLVTTLNVYEKDVTKNGLIVAKKGAIKDYQTVLSAGPYVKDIKVGDVVLIDPKNYRRMKHQEGSLKDGIVADNMVVAYDFDIMQIDGKNVLYLQDRDIKGIIEDYEETEDSGIIIPSHNIAEA